MNNINSLLKSNQNPLLMRYARNSPIRWRKVGFVMLPHELLFDDSLPRAALMVYWVLVVHTFSGKNECYPSLKTLEGETRYSRPTIIEAIEALKVNGWLDVEGDKKSGKVNRYFIKLKK